MDQAIKARVEARDTGFEDMRNEYLSNISLHRTVSMEDEANIAFFLHSSAGGNISGQALSVWSNVETF